MTPIRACLVAASLLAAGIAQAQNLPTPTDASITWKGITLYGAVDIGLQFQTHGVAASDYFPAGTEAPIQKNSAGSVTAVTPNNLSQSRIGLAGAEPLGFGDWNGVFRVETFFNPQSGDLSDALKSLTLNNGRRAHRAVDQRRLQRCRPGLRRCRLCRVQLADLRFAHLRTEHHPARRWHRQVRPDGSCAGVLAHRLVGHHRRRR